MDPTLLDTEWIWHPDWKDAGDNTAGGFVLFRKLITLEATPTRSIKIKITADTKYQLYINGQLVNTGPVKGDAHLWFYDDLDIQSFLTKGENHIVVRVLRLFHATNYATSFPRLQIPGFFIQHEVSAEEQQCPTIQTDESWEAAVDWSSRLRVDQPEDDFLHIYEDVNVARQTELQWVVAEPLRLPKSHGIAPPWVLSPRLIPFPQTTRVSFKALHNIRSSVPLWAWENFCAGRATSLTLPAGTSHHVELEAPHHLTAMLRLQFKRPTSSGSIVRMMYSESYEDPPDSVPYLRCKGDRTDTTKQLYGPEDKYVLAGSLGIERTAGLSSFESIAETEVFAPFHFRTFRYLTLNIEVAHGSDLTLEGLQMDMTHYPLEVKGGFETPNASGADEYQSIWETSTRTLTNCMHDCYEDCPFYEQLQYAMDVRSSCLFTYAVSGDDKMARQAIIQLHNGYRPGIGLIASRGPAHQLQLIPHFSMFWISTVIDHYDHVGDDCFTRQFFSTCNGIVEAFSRRIDPSYGLVSSKKSTYWDFVDWTNEWRPMGIPTAAERTGFQTYTNLLYVYTLQRLGRLSTQLGRPSLAHEYYDRAQSVKSAVRKHCHVDGLYTDGLAFLSDPKQDYSQHNQIWAVLAGVASTEEAQRLLAASVTTLKEIYATDDINAIDGSPTQSVRFTEPSMAMSLYTLRAMSMAGGRLYDDAFHAFWKPWREQLRMNLSTWCEDEVTKRSDCHAWSCAPLYEFMAEVAGVRPADPGWKSIACKPRTRLFKQFRGRVPLGGKFAPGIVQISWTRATGDDLVSVSVALVDLPGAEIEIPIWVTGPNGLSEKHVGSEITLQFRDSS